MSRRNSRLNVKRKASKEIQNGTFDTSSTKKGFPKTISHIIDKRSSNVFVFCCIYT